MQDIRKIDILVRAMATVPGQMLQLKQLLDRLPDNKAERVREVATANGIALHAAEG